VAQVDKDGTVKAAAYGPVPSSLPQSSQSGEYSALAAAEHLKTGACRLFGDCENVVRDWNKGNNRAKASKKVYHRLAEEGRHAETEGCISSFRWVKAHELSSTRARGDKEEIEMAVGNHHADALADEGNKLHPQASATRKAQIKEEIEHANQACRTIASVLTLWPRLARGSERVAKEEVGERVRNAEATRHAWIQLTSGAWHCTQCLSTTRGDTLREERRSAICKGRPDALSAAGRKDLHHELHTVECEGKSITLCVKCGAWAEKRAIGLALKCRKATAAGKATLIRVICKGLHPKRNKPVTLKASTERAVADRRVTLRSEAAVRRLVGRKRKRVKQWAEDVKGLTMEKNLRLSAGSR
jgi:hypothetical protein